MFKNWQAAFWNTRCLAFERQAHYSMSKTGLLIMVAAGLGEIG